MMPHSFPVLNCAACDSNRFACAPNQGCQIFTWTPRSASFRTFKLLAGGMGVFVSEAFSVAFGRGVLVFESVEGLVDVHAERMIKVNNKRTIQNFRNAIITYSPCSMSLRGAPCRSNLFAQHRDCFVAAARLLA